jgi:quinohemoprotein ethanol dehydrogenase
MSYNPRTGLAYYPAIHLSWSFIDKGIDLTAWQSPSWRVDLGVQIAVTGVRSDGVAGSLQAWDPVARKLVWEVPLEGTWNPGTMTSAGGLVFQGRADGNLVAYHAETGAELWRTNLGLGISAPPITYSVRGRQYVAVLVGWGGAGAAVGGAAGAAHGWAYGVHPRRLVTFSVEGKGVLPASPPPVIATPLAAPEFGVDAGLASRGMMEFESTCGWCHGGGALASGTAPDLRASGVVLSETGFADVVRSGARLSQGMPVYADLNDQQLLALRHYIRQRAEADLAAAGKPKQ